MYCVQRSQYIRPKVTVHKGAETIQWRKLFKGGNYMRKYGIQLLEIHIRKTLKGYLTVLQIDFAIKDLFRNGWNIRYCSILKEGAEISSCHLKSQIFYGKFL